MFKGIKNTFKKSEAAVVVQNLLEMQTRSGIFSSDPAITARKLVELVWERNPHLFDGRFGQRPHKLSFAGAALAEGILVANKADDRVSRVYLICLGNVLQEVEVNGRLYPLNSLDFELIEAASKVFLQESEALTSSPLGQELASIL